MALPRRKPNTRLWLLLAGALALRLLLALTTEPYLYDRSCFVAWGDRLAQLGPAAFYADDYFADYPPGYLYLLWLVGEVRAALGIGYDSPRTGLLLALAPALCDCAAAALVWRVGDRCIDSRYTVTLLAAFTAFNPLTLFDTGIWGQIDGAFALPLLLCFVLLEGRRWLPAALCYGAALAVKPQALLAGPVLAVCFLAGIALEQDRLRAVGRCFSGAALALAPVVLAALPFFGARGPAGFAQALVEKYFGTASSYPYAAINAFNWMAALGGNWQPMQDRLFGPVSWAALGLFAIAALTVLLAVLAGAAVRGGRFSPLLLAAFYLCGIFTFSHCMHERYMVPGVLLSLLAAARWNDRRLFAGAFGMSLTGFLNLAVVYSLVGSSDEWLTSATSRLTAALIGLAETASFVVLAFAVWELCAQGRAVPLPAARPRAALPETVPAVQPRWTRREAAALLALTAAAALLSFARLGDLTAAQSPVDANGGAYTVTVTPRGRAAELWVYPGISTSGAGRLTVTDAGGTLLADVPLGYTATFAWTRCALNSAGPLTVTVSDGMVMELSLRDAAGSPLDVQCSDPATPLFDEQALVPHTISHLNSFYFDEIYHARTAYEQLHRMPIYETTHPPLGKDLMMLGVALFGMTGFGWRFSGTLFGVLLVPLAWCFARRLTRRRWAGALAGVLLALDFMRFAQSRMATIDIYATFFILLGAHCMVWYCQSVLQKGVHRSLWPMAIGGMAFGLGCAAKWTGIYAGAGLAVLFFAVLYARWRQRPADFGREFRTAALGGVLFYLLLPLCIYAISYLPYVWQDPAFSLGDWWNCQLYMFRYHSRLEATHPFESRWYTWLLGLRPVWYYQNTNLPAGVKASIAGLAGPVLCGAGLACLVRLLWRQVSGQGSRAGGTVLILYGTQLIPWMLVPRCTFLYHYFPSSMFCLAAIALTLAQAQDTRRAKRCGAALCAVSAVLFAAYYPALSGLPIPDWWAGALQCLPSFGFY